VKCSIVDKLIIQNILLNKRLTFIIFVISLLVLFEKLALQFDIIVDML